MCVFVLVNGFIMRLLFLVAETSLLDGFVNQYTSSYRYVERLDCSKHRNLDPFIAQREVIVRNSGIFGTHDDTSRTFVIGLCIIIVALFGSGYNLESAILQEFDSVSEVSFTAYRQCV